METGDAFADGSSAPWFFFAVPCCKQGQHDFSDHVQSKGEMKKDILLFHAFAMMGMFSWHWTCWSHTSQVVPYSTTVLEYTRWRRAFELSGASVFWGVGCVWLWPQEPTETRRGSQFGSVWTAGFVRYIFAWLEDYNILYYIRYLWFTMWWHTHTHMYDMIDMIYIHSHIYITICMLISYI